MLSEWIQLWDSKLCGYGHREWECECNGFDGSKAEHGLDCETLHLSGIVIAGDRQHDNSGTLGDVEGGDFLTI